MGGSGRWTGQPVRACQPSCQRSGPACWVEQKSNALSARTLLSNDHDDHELSLEANLTLETEQRNARKNYTEPNRVKLLRTEGTTNWKLGQEEQYPLPSPFPLSRAFENPLTVFFSISNKCWFYKFLRTSVYTADNRRRLIAEQRFSLSRVEQISRFLPCLHVCVSVPPAPPTAPRRDEANRATRKSVSSLSRVRRFVLSSMVS